jgi:hypothetical protein
MEIYLYSRLMSSINIKTNNNTWTLKENKGDDQ